MNVYIRTDGNGIPETESDYCAWQGFQALGFRTIFYDSEKALEPVMPNDLVVGRMSEIKRKLVSFGIEVPEYDYPQELKDYLGRNIWTSSLDVVINEPAKWPVFVKPVRDKAFIGFVLQSERNIPRLRDTKPNEPVLCSELVEFEAEYRAFVRYGTVLDVKPYRGDWHTQYNPRILERMIEDYKSIPAGCAVDIGVTKDGRTLLVEVNDGFALGCYGLEPVQYAKLLSARWCELVGIRDECDTFFESVDWIRSKCI